jgi:hypothetical protein
MSGESTPRATAGAEPLERAFGARAVCNACAASTDGYRVVATFLHEMAVVRAYCAACYPAAADGDYHAGGDGLILDYAGFAARFGAPGPPPPPVSPVDRMLASLVRDPTLRALSPASEAFARKRRLIPYQVRASFQLAGEQREVMLTLAPDGRVGALAGDPRAASHVKELIERR